MLNTGLTVISEFGGILCMDAFDAIQHDMPALQARSSANCFCNWRVEFVKMVHAMAMQRRATSILAVMMFIACAGAVVWFSSSRPDTHSSAVLPVAPDISALTSASQFQAKNVIVMIADGWGHAHIQATDFYAAGREGVQAYEQFPVKYAMSTYSASSDGYDPIRASTDPAYVKSKPTDSAAAATALATGVKVTNGTISVDADGAPLESVVEHAEATGRATGVITSVPFCHATPAGFAAHNAARGNYLEIAQQMLAESAIDVIMGAGHPLYDNSHKPFDAPKYSYISEDLWQAAAAGTVPGADADADGQPDPWVAIQSADQFKKLADGEIATPKRLFGLAEVLGTLQQGRAGDTATPNSVPVNAGVPELSTMSLGALRVLNANPKGFFLMIEGGAVDWANHANQTGRMIEEMNSFNATVDAVIAWVEANSNWSETLLIVAGDHETGYLGGPQMEDGRRGEIVNNGAGNIPGLGWYSKGHTNQLIPLFARGDAAAAFKQYAIHEDPVRGAYIDNTDVPKVVFSVLQ